MMINSKYAELIWDRFGIESDLIEASNLHQPFKEKSGKQKIPYSINKYICVFSVSMTTNYQNLTSLSWLSISLAVCSKYVSDGL